MSIIEGKTVLITGGTGSFGKKFVEIVLSEHHPQKVIVFSRDELKQFEMAHQFDHPDLRFFIGDVRDKDRLYRAFDGVDIVVHAAALKQIPIAEYNPFEAIKTNVLGAQNIIDAAIDCGVWRVIALSTDKAANPVNLYGATKLCSDKLFVSGNSYAADKKTKFAVVRYGNVVGSRGSVIPFFKSIRHTGRLPITDPRMTRFWITLDQGVNFVIASLGRMQGGEIFVPKLPSMRITDLAKAIAHDCQLDFTGIRPGEKIHEVMITEDDARHTLEFSDYFIIEPEFPWWNRERIVGGLSLEEGFVYSSGTNTWWLSPEELRRIIDE
ncbi:MAG: UDP-N-acetylglucosamine 4,6-dehydratase (inverting) [Pelotomaculum sp. PtaB.Bin104]|nr:MAG: UDP-N-acetylglucosamine 4,6-dehydratase (inverting) [Pelotomaculum sp. PtaB.Bin104]